MITLQSWLQHNTTYRMATIQLNLEGLEQFSQGSPWEY